MADAPAPEITPRQAAQTMASKQFVGLLVIVSIIGIIVSLAAWCFLELVYQLQRELYTHLPNALGYHNGPPVWWSLPILAISGVIVALAITRLPGDGGHLPANGLAAGGPVHVEYLPSVMLAGIATIGFGIVLGPEAPLIALGSGVALLLIGLARTKMQPQALQIIAAAGAFAAVSFIFASPLLAALLMIEVIGIGGARLQLVVVPGLLAAGIGSLVSLGMGSFTGLSSTAYALPALSLAPFGHPDVAEFGWTIAFAIVIALVTRAIMVGGLETHRVLPRRLLIVGLPAIGLIIGGLAIAFSQITGKSVNEVLFSGQDALPGLVAHAGTYSLGALALLILCKGIAYSMSLGSFRGGPTFPALFLGAAGGIMASRLPGFPLDPAVAVGIGASMVSVLRLPLSSVAVATLLT
ncbi:MAG: chloride channel protein, partial [Solirubrobacteraceae bacterium]